MNMKRWFGLVTLTAALSTMTVACGVDHGSSADPGDPSATPDANSIDKPSAGKVDDILSEELCLELGEPDDCDLCEVAGWYSDGVCDDFCDQPDPDCGETHDGQDLERNGATCAFDLSSPLGDSSSDLDDAITGRTTVTESDLDDLTVVQRRQIGDAMVLLDFLSDEDDLDQAFDAADEGAIDMVELDTDAGAFDWVSFFAGDTEVGVIYERATLNRVGEISDGAILGCAAPDADHGSNNDPQDPADVECSFNQTFATADDTRDLEGFVTDSREVTDASSLSPLERQQIFSAALHLDAITGDEDFDVVFDAVDDGLFILSDVEDNGQKFDWVTFFLGDTEVGALYNDATLEIVGEISDGDILGCSPVQGERE